ncbi:alpha/beta hydrolase fold domain-containing protein [Mycobacterium sp. E2733]|uniref:alpha/beta hydrolase fold domain-containing protein n=1 Tax=Mycobacterium sp. E2733 TaxID=1834138 RepID=UPI0007FC97A0|nr:alpha/beta hydrolase [Mycobacterium sp. E2733]OBH92768.1 esterase [Mycobacterium sp. E2733]
MSAPGKVSGSPRIALRPHDVLAARRANRPRKFAMSDGTPVEVLESGPSVAARLANLTSRVTIRPVLSVGSHVPNFPWPWGLIDLAARVVLPVTATVRETVKLPNASAQLVRAPGVLPADGTRRVVVYFHGGAFLTCGANSHGRLVEALSQFADAPILVVNYRLLPKHSIGMALDDCHDGYQWLRLRGYQPDQIVLAGDSAGGYLALSLAQRLQEEGDEPAALVMISPLLQLAKEYKQAHPNINTDAMFSARAFDALAELVASAAEKHKVGGRPEEIYEPVEHIKPDLPRTLIHVSGSEVLLHDARLAASRLAAVGVPAEVRVWPGQIHDFQLASPMVPEAVRSLRQIGDYIREATG